MFAVFWGQDLNEAEFESRLSAAGSAVEDTLADLLASSPLAGEIARPARLIEAMRYATLAGGKRLRPFLTVEAARLFASHALRFANRLPLRIDAEPPPPELLAEVAGGGP